MKLTLIRTHTKGALISGELYADNKKLCDTLERAGIVPLGWYRMSLTLSPKFRRLLPLLHMVPGHTGIRIHAGNSITDTRGCILVGTASVDKCRLRQSRAAEQRLVELLLNLPLNEEHYIEIATPLYRRSELECMHIPQTPDQ